MPKNVHVILLEDIHQLGRAGDIVTVADGYARNALFPAGKAALATESTQAQYKQKQDKAKKETDAKLKELQEVAELYNGTELEIMEKIKDGDEIFGSVTAKSIADKLSEAGQLSVKPKDITLEDAPIKKTGTYQATVTLSPEVEFALTVRVVPEEAASESDE